MRFGKLEPCVRRSCPTTGPHGSNLASARRSPTFSSGGALCCRARLIRRAIASYIKPEEQSAPFTRRTISAGSSSSCTLMEGACTDELDLLRNVVVASRQRATLMLVLYRTRLL